MSQNIIFKEIHSMKLWFWNISMKIRLVCKWPLLTNPPFNVFGIFEKFRMHHWGLISFGSWKTVRSESQYWFLLSLFLGDLKNLVCTIGDWHPLPAEKLLALGLNIGNDSEVFAQGFLTLPGLNSIHQQCSTNLTSSLDPTSSNSSWINSPPLWSQISSVRNTF